VVPTNDDDWFSPRLARTREAAINAHYVGYYWPSAFIEVPISLRHHLGRIRRAIFPRTPPQWLCTTNNYAVILRSETTPLIASHMQAIWWFVAHPYAVNRVDEHLSVMNRSLASRTSLESISLQTALVRRFCRYKQLYRKALPPGISWCKPYVEMMRDLTDQLELRT